MDRKHGMFPGIPGADDSGPEALSPVQRAKAFLRSAILHSDPGGRDAVAPIHVRTWPQRFATRIVMVAHEPTGDLDRYVIKTIDRQHAPGDLGPVQAGRGPHAGISFKS